MKHIRLALVFILISSIMVGVCGCMGEGKSSTAEQALAYLQDKYNQEFQIISSIDSSLDVPYDEIFFQTSTYPNETVTVFRKKDNNGFYFVDDYYKLIVSDEYNELLQSVIGSCLSEKKVYFDFTADYYPAELDASYSLVDALNNFSDSLFANIYVFVPSSTSDMSEKLRSEIENTLRSNGMICYFALYEINDNDYSSLDSNSYEEYLSSNYQLNPVFKTTVR